MGEANVFTETWDFGWEGVDLARVAAHAGAEALGATVYELQPGAKQAALHVHYANEELVVVLSGTPTLRTLEGERELAAGEVVACLRGRRGAHCLENRSDEPARVLIVSTMVMPEVVTYPERDDVFTMTQPPFTGEIDEAHGGVVRVFSVPDGRPLPPDA